MLLLTKQGVPPKNGKEKPGAMVSGTLAALYTVFGLKLGCSGEAVSIGDEVL